MERNFVALVACVTPDIVVVQVLNAVVRTYAADLNRQGVANVYDARFYPGLNPEAENLATVAHLPPDDPYQYPPQFLLLPRLALLLSNDSLMIRTVWFGIQSLAFNTWVILQARNR